VQRHQVRFEQSFHRNLPAEERRAILTAIANKVDADTTVGRVIDAAEELGWGDKLGQLSLAELAAALLAPANSHELDTHQASAGELEDVDDEGSEDDRHEAKERSAQAKSPAKARAKPAPKAAKKSASKAGGKPAAKAKKAASSTKLKSKPSVRSRASRLKALKQRIDADEAMSLEEAVELLIPVIAELGSVTMQSLEEFTSIGRRKLRFHIGQLVQHEYLERHGMGRGTYYTVIE
jgi:hypothetical protein